MSRPLDPSVPPPQDPGRTVRARGTLQPVGKVDLSTTCPTCSILMLPEHAHYRCPRCGYRDSCCF